MPSISICVASVRARTLPYLIASIRQQTVTDWELIVAAQGSDPDLIPCLERARREDPRVRFIHRLAKGKSAALNAAVALAESPLVAVTDDDCEAASDWLEVIAARFGNPDIQVVGGNLEKPPSRLPVRCQATYVIECVYRPSESDFHGPAGFYFGGANFGFRTEAWERVGGYDEAMGPGTPYPAAEDVDWILRAELADMAMCTTPTCRVTHTYGARKGFGDVFAYARSYARGGGSLRAKYVMRGHPLVRPPLGGFPTSPLSIIKHPERMFLGPYAEKHSHAAYLECMARFELAPNGLFTPKAPAPVGSR